VRFSIVIPSYGRLGEAEHVRRFLRAAEDLGYEGGWVADHLALPDYVTGMISPPMLEPLTFCTWALGITERLRLGVDVLVAPYRHPLVVAAGAATAARLSGGRFVLGVGIGYLVGEFEALGLDPADRAGCTDETLALWRTAWEEPQPLTHAGPRFPVEGVHLVGPPAEPDPVAAPPLWVGGNVPAAFERAARFGDGWHPLFPTPEAYAEGRAQIEAHRAAAGITRPFTYSYSGPMGQVLDEPCDWSAVAQGPAPTVAASALRPEFRYAPPPPHTASGRPLLTGTPDELVDDVAALAHAGVDHIVLRLWVSSSDLDADGVIDQMTRFATDVIPHCPST
jgi:probable F420-dependent oxidoreductase